MKSEKWEVESENPKVESGKWKVKMEVENEQWKMKSEKWKIIFTYVAKRSNR